jgi:transketolase
VPSMELFAKQSDAYKAEVLGTAKARVAVEAGIEMSWNKLLGDKGRFVAMHSFGASGPIDALYAHFGITSKAVVEAVTAQL